MTKGRLFDDAVTVDGARLRGAGTPGMRRLRTVLVVLAALVALAFECFAPRLTGLAEGSPLTRNAADVARPGQGPGPGARIAVDALPGGTGIDGYRQVRPAAPPPREPLPIPDPGTVSAPAPDPDPGGDPNPAPDPDPRGDPGPGGGPDPATAGGGGGGDAARRNVLLLVLIAGLLVLLAGAVIYRVRQRRTPAGTGIPPEEPVRGRVPTPPPSPTFGVLQSLGSSRSIPLPYRRLSSQEGLLVGRDARLCDVILGDSAVSRRHLRLRTSGNVLLVEDLNSTDGSYLDGTLLQPFVPHPLASGQTLSLGRERLLVRLQGTGH